MTIDLRPESDYEKLKKEVLSYGGEVSGYKLSKLQYLNGCFSPDVKVVYCPGPVVDIDPKTGLFISVDFKISDEQNQRHHMDSHIYTQESISYIKKRKSDVVYIYKVSIERDGDLSIRYKFVDLNIPIEHKINITRNVLETFLNKAEKYGIDVSKFVENTFIEFNERN